MDQLELLATNLARKHDLPSALIIAIVRQESDADAWRWRVEPSYRYLWDNAHGRAFRALTHEEIASEQAPEDFSALAGQSVDTEWWGQQASWGAMQIMGSVARELGLDKPFPRLCDLLTGMEYGCAHLAHLSRAYLAKFGWPGVVAAYNAGSPRRAPDGRWVNQAYVDGVSSNGAADLLGGV